MLAPPKIYAIVVLGAWGARNTVMLKKFQIFQPQNSRNAVMLKLKDRITLHVKIIFSQRVQKGIGVID